MPKLGVHPQNEGPNESLSISTTDSEYLYILYLYFVWRGLFVHAIAYYYIYKMSRAKYYYKRDIVLQNIVLSMYKVIVQ